MSADAGVAGRSSAGDAGDAGATAAGARVLVAEDERHLAMLLESFLKGRGHRVSVVHDGRAALSSLAAEPFDVALLDVQMPSLDGLAVLRTVRGQPLPPQVILVTGNATIDTAVTALHEGAYDYVAKPYRMAEVDLLVRRAAERHRLECVAAAGEAPPTEWVTRYAPLRTVLDLVDRTAASLGAMAVSGEPGTGRTLLARRVHAATLARGAPFVELDARSAPARDERAVARLVGAAAGGTLYVRAADALPGAAQRVLRDTLDANGESADAPPRRVIAASVRPLDALPVDGALRERLASLAVELPPLRDRVGDVAALTEVFVRQLGGASPPVVTSAAADRLERHPWPGNVAELRLVLEGAVARAVDGVVGPAHLLLDPPTPPPSAL